MSTIDSLALAVQLASCFYMAGVIAVIQLIHYPSFADIDPEKFGQFHARHTRALGFIVGPVMCAELGSSLWLARTANPWLILNAASVLLLWFITFLVSVPCHRQLSAGFEDQAWTRLVRTNWLRTTLWGLRAGIFLIGLLIFLSNQGLPPNIVH